MKDIMWELYLKFFINMKMRSKLILAFLMFSFPPLLLLGFVTFVYVPSSMLKNIFLALNLAAYPSVIIAAYFFSRNLSKQIIELTVGAKEIARGNLDYQITTVESKDEVGELVSSVKTMMQNLVSSLQSTASVIYGLGEAVYVTDTDHKVTQFNPAAERLLGFSAAEIVGKPCHEFTKYVDVDAPCHTPDCSSTKIYESRESIAAHN